MIRSNPDIHPIYPAPGEKLSLYSNSGGIRCPAPPAACLNLNQGSSSRYEDRETSAGPYLLYIPAGMTPALIMSFSGGEDE
jgi:hypothetical protein